MSLFCLLRVLLFALGRVLIDLTWASSKVQTKWPAWWRHLQWHHFKWGVLSRAAPNYNRDCHACQRPRHFTTKRLDL